MPRCGDPPPAPLWPTTDTASRSTCTLADATAAATAVTSFARSSSPQGASENCVGAAINSGVHLPSATSFAASLPT